MKHNEATIARFFNVTRVYLVINNFIQPEPFKLKARSLLLILVATYLLIHSTISVASTTLEVDATKKSEFFFCPRELWQEHQ